MSNPNKVDIITGLSIPAQIPLDYKTFSESESVLSDLGNNNELALTYYYGLIVLCKEERTRWEWREVSGGESGLLDIAYIYPNGWIVDGVNYSGKSFNFFKIPNSAELLPFYNRIVESTGFSIVDQTITVNALWKWLIQNSPYSNPSPVSQFIPYCAEGLFRIEYLVPNNLNGFTRYPGPETSGIPTAPVIPYPNLYVTYYLVSDSGIGDLGSPVIEGDFIPKSEKDSVQMLRTGVVNFVIMTYIQAKLLINNSVTELRSIAHWGNPNLYNGRKLTVKNDQLTDCLLINEAVGYGAYMFSFPNQADFLLKPKEVIEFSLRITGEGTGVYEYIGTNNSSYPFGVFKFIQKGYGNVLSSYEIGDLFCGWSNDGTIRISEAIWLGGDLTNSDNFMPLVQTEI